PGLWRIGSHGNKAPFRSGGEAGSAAAAQSRLLHFLLYALRRHLAQGLAQCLVATHLLIVAQAQRLAVGPNRLCKWLLRRHGYLYASSTSSIRAGSRSA